MSTVPCNGCMRCCVAPSARLLERDEEALYHSVVHLTDPRRRMLAMRADGACVYLEAGGCGIQDSKPFVCRTFDCRAFSRDYTFTVARKAGYVAVWRKGRSLAEMRNDA